MRKRAHGVNNQKTKTFLRIKKVKANLINDLKPKPVAFFNKDENLTRYSFIYLFFLYIIMQKFKVNAFNW